MPSGCDGTVRNASCCMPHRNNRPAAAEPGFRLLCVAGRRSLQVRGGAGSRGGAPLRRAVTDGGGGRRW